VEVRHAKADGGVGLEAPAGRVHLYARGLKREFGRESEAPVVPVSSAHRRYPDRGLGLLEGCQVV
jgi:hypothetical protein